ncbi:MAG: cytochrome b [Yoonia sp.]|nr:cytochrome b [Yoonia sp.]
MTKIRENYSHIQIALHWLIVLLFAFNYIFGDGMGRIFKAHLRGDEIAIWPGMTHVYVGLTMFWLVVLRMILRWRMGVPEEAPSPKEWMQRASKWTHRLLYVLMLFMPWAGLTAWYVSIEFAAEVHVVLMNALLIVAGVHAAAALYHHFILKDGLMKRMSFRR